MFNLHRLYLIVYGIVGITPSVQCCMHCAIQCWHVTIHICWITIHKSGQPKAKLRQRKCNQDMCVMFCFPWLCLVLVSALISLLQSSFLIGTEDKCLSEDLLIIIWWRGATTLACVSLLFFVCARFSQLIILYFCHTETSRGHSLPWISYPIIFNNRVWLSHLVPIRPP